MEKLGRRVLNKKRNKLVRDKQAQNFRTASSAVILFDAQIPDCFSAIREFGKYLTDQQIKTTVYGYVPEKEVPNEMLLWANYEYITKKDINWLSKPKGPVVEDFFSRTPDILFVFAFQTSLPIEYLAELSPARFKVGCYTDAVNDYDMMINPAETQCDIQFFIAQVKHYLNMLNPS